MEGFSWEEPPTKERITLAADSASSYGGPCDFLEQTINAVLKCLGFGPISQPSPKRGEDIQTQQSTSDDPSPSTKPAKDHLSVSEFGMKTREDVEVESVKVGGRRPNSPPIDPGRDPQTN